jgi:ribosomal protein L11 methyltransferase
MQLTLKNPQNDSASQSAEKTIRRRVMAVVTSSPARISPAELKKILSQKYGWSQKRTKSAIRDLVADGELTYTYEFGSSFLESSFDRPVRVSKYVVLKPPGHCGHPRPEDVVVQIQPGVSFGAGRHPTTRLAVRGIEHALKQVHAPIDDQSHGVLDIGTGSGVLVLAAVKFGLNKGLGIDIDPCARAEAAVNVRLNGLEDRIEISDRSLNDIHQRFFLITANLRFPSLKRIYADLVELTVPNAMVVLSGVRTGELGDLLKVYTTGCFKLLWTAAELDWLGVLLQKQTG